MKNKSIYLAVFFSLIVSMQWTSPVRARMVKEVFLGVFRHAPSMEDADRFYTRYHGPETMRLAGPWIRRYQLWRPFEPPEEAVERFGAVRGRYGEQWYGSEQDYLERPPMRGFTTPPFKSGDHTVTIVPALPTEEFYDSDPHPDKTTILRWVTVIRYPDDVSIEDGEKWFLEVHAREALKQYGLLKFVSHRVLDLDSNPGRGSSSFNEEMSRTSETQRRKPWVRVNEYWYKDFDTWRKAVIESPPEYTAPSWGGTYPFVEMSSTFIPYMPDIDFIKGGYIVP